MNSKEIRSNRLSSGAGFQEGLATEKPRVLQPFPGPGGWPFPTAANPYFRRCSHKEVWAGDVGSQWFCRRDLGSFELPPAHGKVTATRGDSYLALSSPGTHQGPPGWRRVSSAASRGSELSLSPGLKVSNIYACRTEESCLAFNTASDDAALLDDFSMEGLNHWQPSARKWSPCSVWKLRSPMRNTTQTQHLCLGV